MRPGSSFGELQLYADVPTSPVTVIASRRSLLRAVPYEAVRSLAERDSELAANLMRSMSRKALSFLRQVEDMVFRTARQRVSCPLRAMFSAVESDAVSLEIAQEPAPAWLGLTA